MRLMGTIPVLCLMASAASGTTFNYVGTPLYPALLGGTGAKTVTFSFSAPRAPAAGKCVRALKLLKYADGAHTLGRLRRDGYQIIHYSDTGPVTFSSLCLSADGVTLSGVYEITLSRNVYPFTDTYSISSGGPNNGDQVDFYVYAGAVPSVYSDVSTSLGIWTITK